MLPYIFNEGRERVAFRNNGDGRCWIITPLVGCLLPPAEALQAGKALIAWAKEVSKKQVTARKRAAPRRKPALRRKKGK